MKKIITLTILLAIHSYGMDVGSLNVKSNISLNGEEITSWEQVNSNSIAEIQLDITSITNDIEVLQSDVIDITNNTEQLQYQITSNNDSIIYITNTLSMVYPIIQVTNYIADINTPTNIGWFTYSGTNFVFGRTNSDNIVILPIP